MNLIVYSKSKSPRLEYILNVILGQLLGIEYLLITNKIDFEKSSSPKINFSDYPFSCDIFHIIPHTLLFEKSIKPQNIEVYEYQGLPAFFKSHEGKGDLPFDIFSMAFYLLSRYEEYLPFPKDDFGRFTAKESLVAKHGFLEMPLINLWAKKLGALLKARFPSLAIREPEFKFQPTYDIDYVWAYLNKGFFRTSGGFLKDLLTLNFQNISTRTKVLLKIEKDPFFTFDYLNQLHEKNKHFPIFFFLLANWGKFDKNTSYKNPALQKSILTVSEKYDIGIHPSFQSNSKEELITVEKLRLERISRKTISKSRQHFLILDFPRTYQNLIKAGIKEDYTMGYASRVGFRASIASSFFWYDIENEKITALKVHPFQVMDVTLKQYLNLSPEEVIQKITPIINVCKEVGGTFTTLWHNSSLSDETEWRGWRKVYEQILTYL